MKGVVKKIPARKGFGFIRGTDSIEYFFHRDDFYGHWDDLEVDFNAANIEIEVEFDPNPRSPKGPRAENVKRLDHPNRGD
jgi:cold shock CspA family protein